MSDTDNLQIELKPYSEAMVNAEYDLDKIIYDLDSQIELLSSQADKFDYLVSIGSGVLCGALDILWVGEFSLERGRGIASDKIEGLVTMLLSIIIPQKGESFFPTLKKIKKHYPTEKKLFQESSLQQASPI
jgi:hypothetical protein